MTSRDVNPQLSERQEEYACLNKYHQKLERQYAGVKAPDSEYQVLLATFEKAEDDLVSRVNEVGQASSE